MMYQCQKCENIHHEDDWHYYTITHDNPFIDWNTFKFDPKNPGVVTVSRAKRELNRLPSDRKNIAGYWFICPSCEREVWDTDIVIANPMSNVDAQHLLRRR